MGLYANAELIWGIPILAFNEDTGEYTEWWVGDDDDDDADWRELSGDLVIRSYGHYDDPDNHRGILTVPSVKSYRADCWEPTRIDVLEARRYNIIGICAKANREAKESGLDVDFHTQAGWWLVASYG
jgi:hypothetical protein